MFSEIFSVWEMAVIHSTLVRPFPAHAVLQDRRTCIKKESEEASNPEITHVAGLMKHLSLFHKRKSGCTLGTI